MLFQEEIRAAKTLIVKTQPFPSGATQEEMITPKARILRGRHLDPVVRETCAEGDREGDASQTQRSLPKVSPCRDGEGLEGRSPIMSICGQEPGLSTSGLHGAPQQETTALSVRVKNLR